MTTRLEYEQWVFAVVKRFILIHKKDVITIEDILGEYGYQELPDETLKQMISEKTIASCLTTLCDPNVAALRRYPIHKNPKKGYRYEYDDEAALRYFTSQVGELSRSLVFERINEMVADGWLTHPAEGVYRVNVDKVWEIEGVLPSFQELLADLNKLADKDVTLEEIEGVRLAV